jgi:malate synthase
MNLSLAMFKPSDNIDKLLAVHMTSLHKRLVKRFVDQRKQYTIDVPEDSAIAFFEFFQNVNISDGYGRTIVQRIMNEIDNSNLVITA